jgi:mRNA-degrading endonuclease RelE of RelBE toxin-antitoxin system
MTDSKAEAFKLRVGAYRVLYEFDADQGRVFLHYVGHRRDIYKRV